MKSGESAKIRGTWPSDCTHERHQGRISDPPIVDADSGYKMIRSSIPPWLVKPESINTYRSVDETGYQSRMGVRHAYIMSGSQTARLCILSVRVRISLVLTCLYKLI